MDTSEIVRQQHELIEKLRREIAHLKELNERLQGRIEKLERESKRQAAPFRKKTKKQRKKPGRKPGKDHGEHQRRAAPEQIDETYHAPLPGACPKCESEQLETTETVVQYQTEIPRKVIQRQFNIDVGHCQDCGCRVQGRHKLQTSDAVGAAAVQLGPKIHAAVAIANKELGLSHGKVKRLFEMLFKVNISRSGSCRSVLRTGRKLETAYEEARQAVRGSPQVVADETGWRVEGRTAWLHDFVGDDATVYDIDPTRSIAPAERLLGRTWSGVLVHDGWSVYDLFKAAQHQQCLAHLLRRCENMIERGKGAALAFPRKVKAFLKTALAVRDRFRAEEMTTHGLKVMAGRLKSGLHDLIFPNKTNEANEKLAAFLYKHLGSLFTFLREPGVDATNFRAEQAIRPAVVNRKVWGGNRTWAGALAQSRIMTTLRTLHQRLQSSFDYLHSALTSTKPQPLPAGR